MNSKPIDLQERVLLRIRKELESLKKEETEARRLWTLGYKKYMSATKQLTSRKKKGLTTDVVKDGITNKTVQTFWETVEGWEEKSQDLTKKRDDARFDMEKKKEQILQEEESLQNLLHQEQIQLQQMDSIVDMVYLLNGGVVAALENMDRVLSSEIFPLLHEKGTQKTIENSQSTRRLVIMTNSINIMDISKVEEAKEYIDAFFVRIRPNVPEPSDVSQDDMVIMLSALLKELLVIKVKIKAGPSLSRFLSLEFNQEKFPELYKAQKLLAGATNYSRSGLYVRLFERKTKDDTWQPVRQS
ncbi:MAG: hypothetical protein WCH65_09160 [bacterium]